MNRLSTVFVSFAPIHGPEIVAWATKRTATHFGAPYFCGAIPHVFAILPGGDGGGGLGHSTERFP